MEQETQTKVAQRIQTVLADITPDEFDYLVNGSDVLREVVSNWLDANLTDEQLRVFEDSSLKDFDAYVNFVVTQATPHIRLLSGDLSAFADEVTEYVLDNDDGMVQELIDEDMPLEGSFVDSMAVNHVFTRLSAKDFQVDPGTNIDTILDLLTEHYYTERESIAVLAGYAKAKFTGANFGDWLADDVQSNPETTLAVLSLKRWTGIRDVDAFDTYRDDINALIAG